VQADKISYDELDIGAVRLLDQALLETDEEKKLRLFETLLSEFQGSEFISEIEGYAAREFPDEFGFGEF
jgi:hypothetical protein